MILPPLRKPLFLFASRIPIKRQETTWILTRKRIATIVLAYQAGRTCNAYAIALA
jgi:hypothetical protein